MGVENAKVHNYLRWAVDNHWSGPLMPRLLDAFYDINGLRSEQCENLDLAAADHYLIMRWVICKCSPAVAGVASLMVTGYDGVYKAARWAIEQMGGPDIVFRTGKCRATSFSPMVIAWAQTGISDGILDCTGPLWQSNPKIFVPKYPVGYFNRLFY